MGATFTVESIHHIRDRGPVISRSQEASKVAWTEGQRWATGDTATCGHLRATVIGIERFCVPVGHPAHNDGALLLRGVEISDLEIGQVWTQILESESGRS